MKHTFLFCVIISAILLMVIVVTFLHDKKKLIEWKIYNLEELASITLEGPPTTLKDAICAAYSLPEAKTVMSEQNQLLLDWDASVEKFYNKKTNSAYWIVSGFKKHPPEVSEDSWVITFRTSLQPAYICNVSFSATEIVQGVGHIDCRYEKK